MEHPVNPVGPQPISFPPPLHHTSGSALHAPSTSEVETEPELDVAKEVLQRVYSLPRVKYSDNCQQLRDTFKLRLPNFSYIRQDGHDCPRTEISESRSIFQVMTFPLDTFLDMAISREVGNVTKWSNPQMRESIINNEFYFDTSRPGWAGPLTSLRDIIPAFAGRFSVETNSMTNLEIGKDVREKKVSIEISVMPGTILQRVLGASKNYGMSFFKRYSQETDLATGHRQSTRIDSRRPERHPESWTDEGVVIQDLEELLKDRDLLQPYIVVGLLSQVGGAPQERLIRIRNPSKLFRSVWWSVVRLRGSKAIFSLKDLKGFGIYKCGPHRCGSVHERVKIDTRSEQALRDFFHAYQSWYRPKEIEQKWMDWISGLNSNNPNPLEGDMLSLEILLGWSAPRISVVVLTPVLLSLGIGLWLNSKNWGDATTIQTAWSVASYIATAGAFLGALLAIISSIDNK